MIEHWEIRDDDGEEREAHAAFGDREDARDAAHGVHVAEAEREERRSADVQIVAKPRLAALDGEV